MSEDAADGGQHEALVPPHDSEVVPPTPSRIREVWHPRLSTDDLVKLFSVAERGSVQWGDLDPLTSQRGLTMTQGVVVGWNGGGQTITTANKLRSISKPEKVATVSIGTSYPDGSMLQLHTLFKGPGKPPKVLTYWYGVGEGRRRAEEIEGLLSELRSDRPVATFLARPGRVQVWSVAFAAALLFAAYRLVPWPPLSEWAVAGWSFAAGAVLVLAAIILPRLFLSGSLSRSRPRRDWQAIGQVASAVFAALALLISLLSNGGK